MKIGLARLIEEKEKSVSRKLIVTCGQQHGAGRENRDEETSLGEG